MSAIRPARPALPAAPSGQAPPMRAAQAAFFRAALADVQAAPAAAAPTRARAPTPMSEPEPSSASSSDALRLPRLGQFLDIRV
ncbi:hypothetical protein BZG35_00690 [Brevundimonas sp. LM2]|uniref:hypothetical protein n=1 Tax=Brevundimonas sp. LM2 TaxID=1938605 RepID=UPI000983F677|nr:hypothetical protein [Brevundimonas sp. LM2]AQR60335.1 hypothetical protein BZG35_00690 [Brevundimonas sp. LM2]